MGRTPSNRTPPSIEIPAPRPTRRNMPEVRSSDPPETVSAQASGAPSIVQEAPPSSIDPVAPVPLPKLPVRSRMSSRPGIGAARPRRTFLPPAEPPPEGFPEAKPTLLSKATVPALPRVQGGRLEARISGSMPLVRNSGAPHAGAPVVEVRRPPPAPSRGLAMDRLVEILPGRLVAGRYRIEELIGRGAMGVIFSATDTSPSAQVPRVALKVLDPEIAHDPAARERFRSEALAAQRIASPHVVRVFDADTCVDLLNGFRSHHDADLLVRGPSEGVPFIAMEMLYGHDLREILQTDGPMRPRKLTNLLAQVAATLDKAHALGIVHRDLKPANLFLTRAPDGSDLVKILDFGVAQLTRPSTGPRGAGDAGLFGTPWYMAPEQASGQPATPASDLWALALIAFRLLTGESYWVPAAVPDLLGEIEKGPTVAPSTIVRSRGLVPHAAIGRAFDAWFFHACAVDPSKRFVDAVTEVEELSRALASDIGR